MFDQQSQSTTPHIMRTEPLEIRAPRARLSVTRTNRTLSAHGLVVCFHFAFSRRDRQFDRNGWIFLFGEGRRSAAKAVSLLLFSCASAPPGTKKKGRGSRDNLPGRGKRRDTGRVSPGQINQDSGGIFRSVKVRRRNKLLKRNSKMGSDRKTVHEPRDTQGSDRIGY